MEEQENKYVKRTQKDYTMSFKMAVVREVEETGIGVCAVARKYGIQSESTITAWLRKFGNFDHQNKPRASAKKSKDLKVLELEQQINRLKYELEIRDHKVAFFDMMIGLAEKEFNIDIRNNAQQ